MTKTLKGSLAALAAAVLLLGGAGSLAYWTDSASVAGTGIDAGELDLGEPDCGDGWVLDGGDPYVAQLLVPGDTLTKTCSIDLTASGAHLGADLSITQPEFSGEPNALVEQLQVEASFSVNGQTKTHITSADDTGATPEIQAVVTVAFPNLQQAQNASQDLSAVLQSVAITATQTHDAPVQAP